jgi:hypothetical protein
MAQLEPRTQELELQKSKAMKKFIHKVKGNIFLSHVF